MLELISWIVGCVLWVLSGVLFGCVMEYVDGETILMVAVKIPLLVITGGSWIVCAIWTIGLPVAIIGGHVDD
jgi:hypothetical protein